MRRLASAGERLLVALGVVVLAALVAAAILLPAPSQRQYPSLRSLSASVASAASEVLGGAWEALPNATEMFALNYANLSAEVTFLNGTTSASRVTSVNVTILLPVGPANITLPPAGYVITLENPSARAQIVVVLFVYPNSTEPYRILDMFASSFGASPNETSGSPTLLATSTPSRRSSGRAGGAWSWCAASTRPRQLVRCLRPARRRLVGKS